MNWRKILFGYDLIKKYPFMYGLLMGLVLSLVPVAIKGQDEFTCQEITYTVILYCFVFILYSYFLKYFLRNTYDPPLRKGK